MKYIVILSAVLLLVFSCKEEQPKEPIHKDLIGFKTMVLAESDEGLFDEIEKKADEGKIRTTYINDIIYVTYYDILNACGNYEGNLEKKNNIITLKLNLISEEVCTSVNARRVTFIIDNPGLENKVIIK